MTGCGVPCVCADCQEYRLAGERARGYAWNYRPPLIEAAAKAPDNVGLGNPYNGETPMLKYWDRENPKKVPPFVTQYDVDMGEKEKLYGDLRRAKEILATLEWGNKGKGFWACPSCGKGYVVSEDPPGKGWKHWGECELAKFMGFERVI